MSAWVILQCDAEGCQQTSDQAAETKPEARRWARDEGHGWLVGIRRPVLHPETGKVLTVEVEDYCPDHIDEGRAAVARARDLEARAAS